MTRVVHYLNQFFTGVGGEDAASTPPARTDGAVGPGRKLQALLGDDFEVVATVSCGDDYAAGEPKAVEEILALVKDDQPDVVVIGPAFSSGRYGLACGRLAAAATQAGLVAVAAMHQDNPGVEEARGAPMVRSGEAAREMGPSLEALAAAVRKLAAGEDLTEADGRLGKAPRRNRIADQNAARRAVALVLARLGGDREATEIPLPDFDNVTPAAPVEDLTQVTVALVSEGAVVPADNPDKLESARATRWARYSVEGRDSLPPGEFISVHGGFSTVAANEDPQRILPLDVARQLESEGAIGRLHHEYLVTAGNGTSVGNAKRFGIEWVADLRNSGVRAAILTAT
jgi:glycine reductase